MKTLAQLRNHPAVQEIILESDYGRRTYWINLKPDFATDHGRGQQSGSESTLRGVAVFLSGVAAIPAEAPATLHAESPRPADAEATRRAVIALAPAYSVALADGRPAAVELEARAADGLEPEFLEACAEEGNPVNTLAAHLADVKERAAAELEQAKQLARTHGTGRAAVEAARNAWQAVAVALNALNAAPTPPTAPKPDAITLREAPDVARGRAEAAEAVTHARRDFQAAAAALRAYVAESGRVEFSPAADALAFNAAAIGTRNAASAYAAALDACVASVNLDHADFAGLTSPAWRGFAENVAGVRRAKCEAADAALHAQIAAIRAADAGERAAPAPDAEAAAAVAELADAAEAHREHDCPATRERLAAAADRAAAVGIAHAEAVERAWAARAGTPATATDGAAPVLPSPAPAKGAHGPATAPETPAPGSPYSPAEIRAALDGVGRTLARLSPHVPEIVRRATSPDAPGAPSQGA